MRMCEECVEFGVGLICFFFIIMFCKDDFLMLLRSSGILSHDGVNEKIMLIC